MTYDFADSLVVGAQGEVAVFGYLQGLPNIAGIVNVTDRKDYQSKDIDFVALLKNGDIQYIEVKTDTHASENFFFETMSNVEAQTVGCLYKTKSHILCYYYLNTHELYLFVTKKLVKWFDEHKDAGHFARKKVKNSKGEKTYTTEGFLVPKSFLEHNFIGYRRVILE